MSWGACRGGLGGTVCPFGIHHQNSPQCLQVEVSIEISIAWFWANFSGNDPWAGVKHHTEEASYGAVLTVFHGYVPALLYRLDYQIYVHQLYISALPSMNEAFQVLLFLIGF